MINGNLRGCSSNALAFPVKEKARALEPEEVELNWAAFLF